MGPGIFTRHSKLVFGSILAIVVLITAVQLYFQFRSPVGGVSPYETVNDLFEQDLISFTIERDAYPTDVEVIQVTLRNDADDIIVDPAPYCLNEWLLEKQVGGIWHSMRLSPQTAERYVNWEFPTEEYGPNSGPSGVVMWGGGEQRYLCSLAKYYQTPLEAGTYRIVFPKMEHRNVAALAAEFEVR